MRSRRRGGSGRPPWPVSKGVVCRSVKFLGAGSGELATPAQSPARREVCGGRSGTAGAQPAPTAGRGCGAARGLKDGMGTALERCWAGRGRAQEGRVVMGGVGWDWGSADRGIRVVRSKEQLLFLGALVPGRG